MIKSKVFGEITAQDIVDPSPYFELTNKNPSETKASDKGTNDKKPKGEESQGNKDPYVETLIQENFSENTEAASNGFLCAAAGCDFFTQNLDQDEGEDHYNLFHRDRTLTENSFIAVNAEMTEAMEILKEVRKIKKELSQ